MDNVIGQVMCSHCSNIFTRLVGIKSMSVDEAQVVLMFKCENSHVGFTELVINRHEGESFLSTRKVG